MVYTVCLCTAKLKPRLLKNSYPIDPIKVVNESHFHLLERGGCPILVSHMLRQCDPLINPHGWITFQSRDPCCQDFLSQKHDSMIYWGRRYKNHNSCTLCGICLPNEIPPSNIMLSGDWWNEVKETVVDPERGGY